MGSAVQLQRAPSAEIRRYVEQALAHRVAAPFAVTRPEVELVPSGIAAIDALTGGLPRGALTEICGPASSGRTTVLVAALAAATQRGEACCLIDATDAFDPHSAAAAGVELQRLLWVRCGRSEHRKIGSSEDRKKIELLGYRAIDSPRRREGTKKEVSGFKFQVSSCHSERSEESAINNKSADRQQSNKSAFANSVLGTRYSQRACSSGQEQFGNSAVPQFGNPDDRRRKFRLLEQALKVTDLVLQGGGFGLVAIDLADMPNEAARRVPLTSWFRFRRAVEKTPTVLMAIEQELNAKTCASLVVKLSAVSTQQSTELATGNRQLVTTSHSRLLRGLDINVEVLRTPKRKQPGSVRAHFTARGIG